MKSNPCSEFFAQHINNPEKVKELQKIEERINWEVITASEYSPSTVVNEEDICRQILRPTHVNIHNNELKPTAFDDVANKGLSVDRLRFCDLDKIKQVAIGRVTQYNMLADPERVRTFFAIAKFVVRDVRSIMFNEHRCFGIYDTARPDNVAHADICQIVSGKFAGRSVRSKLIDLAKLELVSSE
jgi:hypothetical protein